MSIAALVLLVACGGSVKDNQRPMKVTASIAPLAWLVNEIGGDSVEVQVLLPQGSDAESFEPQIGKLRELQGASLFAVTGLLPFENKIATVANEGAGVETVSLSTGLDLITGTHGGDEPDPHIWTSVRNLRVMARTLLSAMSEERPAAADVFTANWKALDMRLDSLDRLFETTMGAAGRPTFLVWHPSLSYFARDYGLRQISVGFEGKENSAVGTKERIDAALAGHPKVYFIQVDEDSRAAQSLPVPDETKIQSINLMAPDWEAEISVVADALR